MSSRTRTLLALVLVAYAAWGAVYIGRSSFESAGQRVFSTWDDGMVSMQYARNLVSGEGLRWMPGGEKVAGFVNLGPTLLMSLGALLALPAEKHALAFQLLCLLALLAVLRLAFHVARRAFPEEERIAWATLLGTAGAGTLAIWGLQGADPVFVALWTLACLAFTAGREEEPRWPAAFYAVLGLAWFVRPDVAPVALGLLGIGALGTPGAVRKIALGTVAVLGVAGLEMAFHALYFGDPLPLPYYNKITGSPLSLVLASGLRQMSDWLPSLLPLLGLAAIGTWAGRRRRVVLQAAGIVVYALAYDLWVGGDWNSEWGSRFVVSFAPLLALLSAVGLHAAGAALVPEPRRRGPVFTALFLVAQLGLSTFASPPTPRLEWIDPRAETMLRSYNQRNHERARYFRDHTTPDAVLALHWAGVPAYFSERFCLDVLGKTDDHIARMHVERFIPAHSKWDWDYMLGREPDIFLTATRGLSERDDFRRDYFRVRYPGGEEHDYFYLRKRSYEKLLSGAVVIDQERNKGIDSTGLSALELAAYGGDVATTRRLLAEGAAVEVRNLDRGSTPLHVAAAGGYAEIVELLLAHGADPRVTDERGGTPLHLAAQGGSVPVAALLLEAGAEVDARTSIRDITPLHLAALAGKTEMARFLVESGADLEAANVDGVRAVDMARRNFHLVTAEVLSELAEQAP